MPQSIRCPYCRSNHVDTFPCKQAKAAGITKADLPDAYYIDMETGECPPPKRTQSTTVQESGGESRPAENPVTTDIRESERKTLQQWRERNRERYNETMRQWREDNREKVRAYQREYMRQRRKARQSES